MKRTAEEEEEETGMGVAVTLPRDIWHHFARCMLARARDLDLNARVALRFLTAVGNTSLLKEMQPLLTEINTAPRCSLCHHDLAVFPMRVYAKKRGRRPRLVEKLGSACVSLWCWAENSGALCRDCDNGQHCTHCLTADCSCMRRYYQSCAHCGGRLCGHCAVCYRDTGCPQYI